jgi:membrane protein
MPADERVEPVSGASLWELTKGTLSSWMDVNAPRLGAALSFYSVLAVAPLLVLCIGLAGLVFGQEAAQGQVAAQVQNVVGAQGGQVIQTLLAESSRKSSGIIAASVGLLMLLFSASGVFGELRDSLNLVWGAKSASGSGIIGMIKYRFFSFAMVLGIGFLLLVSLLLNAAIAAAEKFFGGYLPLPGPVLHLINFLVSLVAVTVLFALLYKVVPDVHIEWQDVWIGAAVTALLFSIGKFLIGLYLGKASVGSAYGAAGSLVVFLVWVYYSAQIFFLGAAFTHEFSERHGSRAQARAAGNASPAVQEVRKFRDPKLA